MNRSHVPRAPALCQAHSFQYLTEPQPEAVVLQSGTLRGSGLPMSQHTGDTARVGTGKFHPSTLGPLTAQLGTRSWLDICGRHRNF